MGIGLEREGDKMANKILKNAELVLSNTKHWHLSGNIYNDERFEDNTFIITSRIVDINLEGKCLFVTTKTGSVYMIEDYSSKDFKKLVEAYSML